MIKQKLDNLQSLRGIAALLVVWHHSGYFIGNDVVANIIGTTGVPLFFMISGFIMVYTTRSIGQDVFYNIKEFSLKRLIRILPLFYFAIAIWLFIWRKDLIHDPQIDKILKTALFIPHFTETLGPYYGFWILRVNWSLNYEMFFYLLFAVSFLFSSKRYYFLYVSFFMLLIGIPFLLNGNVSFDVANYVPYDFKYFNLMSNPILWCFVIGVSIGLLIDKISLKIKSRVGIYVYYLTSIVFFALYVSRLIPSYYINEIIVCTMLLIGALLMDFNMNITFLVPKWMVSLGDISYSIYLMHAVVFLYVPLLAQKFRIENLIHNWYAFLVILMIVFLVSSLTYYLIENRLTNYLRKKIV